jgi:hypothetical protein
VVGEALSVYKTFAFTAAVTFTLMATVASGGSADASPPVPSEQSVSPQIVEGRMLPDCDSLSESAREYARLHDIEVCGVVGIHDDGSASYVPKNKIPGDCGSSAIYLYRSRVSPSQVTFEWGFESTVGSMVIRDLMVTWAYGSKTGSHEDYGIMGSAVYNGEMNKVFADKTTHAVLLGTAITGWGLDCYLAGPTASLPA